MKAQEAIFEVHAAVAHQKRRQIDEKRTFRSNNLIENKFFGVEKRNVRIRLKHVLAKFRADLSHVRGVTNYFHLVIGRNELNPTSG